MREGWAVQIEDGTHTVDAEIIWGVPRRIKISWDDVVIDFSAVWVMLGRLASFSQSGHEFEISALTMLAPLVLSMDGLVVQRGYVEAEVTFVSETNVKESEEILAVEDYPLDNSFGNRALTSEREVSRKTTNELTFTTSIGVTIGLPGKTAIAVELSRETGHKIGEEVTESLKLTFSVDPKSRVHYKVLWKRRVRGGERSYRVTLKRPAGKLQADRLVGIGSVERKIPYQMFYGLSHEVQSADS
jgi:hypothetical protein